MRPTTIVFGLWVMVTAISAASDDDVQKNSIWAPLVDGRTCSLTTMTVKKEGVLLISLLWNADEPAGLSAIVGLPTMADGDSIVVESAEVGPWTISHRNGAPVSGPEVAKLRESIRKRSPIRVRVEHAGAPPMSFAVAHDEGAAVNVAMFDGCVKWMKKPGRNSGVAERKGYKNERVEVAGGEKYCGLDEKLEGPAGQLQVNMMADRYLVGMFVYGPKATPLSGWTIEPNLISANAPVPDGSPIPLQLGTLASLAKDLEDGKSYSITAFTADGQKHLYQWGSPQTAGSAAMFGACLRER